jgi:hypothetical protein
MTAESSFFRSGEEDQNECPIMSFTCDETPGILEKIYLDDGISFQETNDVFHSIGILRGGHNMVKLGILVDENGGEVDWSDLAEAQKTNFEEDHDIIPPKENTNAAKPVGGEGNVSTNASSIAGLSSSPSPAGGTTVAELDPAPTSPQPPVQGQVLPQNTQEVPINNGDTGNTKNVNLPSSSSYINSMGSLHVIGELQNTSPDSRDFVK